MIRSMTGFGKSSYSDEILSIDMEIKSVNSRYLDLSIKMPNQFNFLEDKLRKKIKETVQRGRVDLFIRSNKKNVFKSKVSIDLESAIDMKDKLLTLVQATGISQVIKISDILKNDDILTFEAPDIDEGLIEASLMKALSAALEKLDHMRLQEGENLKADLLDNISSMEKITDEIAGHASNVIDETRERIRKNIEQAIDKNKIDQDRLAQEIVYYADKADINEELKRLKSHFMQFRQTMDQSGPIGKKLDFISQEFLRETNTIGSKSNKGEITNLVIEQKTIIEKIKEQVQNVE